MRVVLDANIFVSALIAQYGNPARIFNLWREDKFELVISLPILEEINRVIHYPRIQKKYKLPEENVATYLNFIANTATVVNPHTILNVIEKDPSDNRYLECAVTAQATYIITGDSHLLELKEYNGIFIMTPASFLTLIRFDEDKQ